jgi:methylated-DNA-[protein]-cysteine S-methyltransferase
MQLHYDVHHSPVGDLVLIATEAGLAAILFTFEQQDWQRALPSRFQQPHCELQRDVAHPDLQAAHEWLRRYFVGEALTAADFRGRLDAQGTEFQLAVWHELQRIPYGHTTSYGSIARRLGDANGSRAVGLANGQNPLPILWPCHRVIGKDGSLVGFGGGLARKEYLLGLEQGGQLKFE